MYSVQTHFTVLRFDFVCVGEFECVCVSLSVCVCARACVCMWLYNHRCNTRLVQSWIISSNEACR